MARRLSGPMFAGRRPEPERLAAGLEGLAGAGRPASSPSGGPGLTPREREVLALAAGRGSRQKGDERFVRESSAGARASDVPGELGASGRTEAATPGHQPGLLRDSRSVH